jgi:hypothetical protein
MPDTKGAVMGFIGKLVGTPKEYEKEKGDHEVVETPEFDITQYAKKLAVVITTLAVAGVAALKGFDVAQTEGMVIAIFGVIAAAMLGVSAVMAVDLAARAYLAGAGAAQKKEKEKKDGGAEPGGGDGAPAPDPKPGVGLVAAAPGTVVWLEGDEEPHPLVAISGLGDGKDVSYLVADGSKVSLGEGDERVSAIHGAPKWHPADAVRAVKPAKWR